VLSTSLPSHRPTALSPSPAGPRFRVRVLNKLNNKNSSRTRL